MFRNITTVRTGLRGIFGVNQLYQNTSNFSLIRDKLSKLVESPRLVFSPLAMVNRCPRIDAIEIFKGDGSLCVFSLRHKSFADCMVGVSPKVSFSASQFSKMPFSRFGSLALKRSFEGIGLFPNLVYLFTRIKVAIAINGKVDNAKVNPQHIYRVVRCGFGCINCKGEVKDTLAKQKVALFDNPVNADFLIFTNPDRDELSPLKCKNGNLVQSLEGKDALVIDHSRVELEMMQSTLIPTINLNDFADNPNSHLSRQPIVFSQIAVGKMVKLYLRCGIFLKSKIGDIIAGFVKAFHSFKKRLVLLLARGKFNHQSLFHNPIIEYINPFIKKRNRFAFHHQSKRLILWGYFS